MARSDLKERARRKLDDALAGLTTTLAILSALVIVPEIFGHTVDWISGVVARKYGQDFVIIAQFVWFGVLSGLVYFATEVVAAIVIISGVAIFIVKFVG